ncbi:MAG: hypothetical protein ABA06_02740 [Parcubacteria bacterium C7867-001]|nr:MAG: hypothetical protein ABA06_02740 [Parcubacteria bacterium C7867-001]
MKLFYPLLLTFVFAFVAGTAFGEYLAISQGKIVVEGASVQNGATALPTSAPSVSATPVATPTSPSVTPSAPAKTTTNKTSTPSGITKSTVAAHSTSASCWTIVSGNVYDLTSWINQHPGGSSAIRSMCGRDGTEDFLDQHGGDRRATAELASFKIGALTN